MAADHTPRLRRSRLPAALALVVALVACDAPSANGPIFAYDPSLTYVDVSGSQHQFLYHWPLGSVVRVFVDDRGQPAGWDIAAAVDAGGKTWESQMFYREVSLRRVSTAEQADVIVHYDVVPPTVEIPLDCSVPFVQAAGVTVLCPNADYTGLEVLPLAGATAGGHVKMDVTAVVSRIADDAQLRRVVAHEIGHVFGIGAHSGSREDLMFPVPQVDAPSAADGQTLRYVLHQSGAVTP